MASLDGVEGGLAVLRPFNAAWNELAKSATSGVLARRASFKREHRDQQRAGPDKHCAPWGTRWLELFA